jgi:hypothetical protein
MIKNFSKKRTNYIILLLSLSFFSHSSGASASMFIKSQPEKASLIDHNIQHLGFPVKDVDHSDPWVFARPTPQTQLSQEIIEELNLLFPGDNTIEKIGEVYSWVRGNFDKYRGGGRMVAKQSAQQLFNGRKLSGCNDWGLLQTAILRSLKYPVVFMNAVNIQWAKEYRKNISKGFSGHTFLEIYVKGRWILMDPTSGHYIEDYDFSDPVLHIHKKRGGFFVYQKGLDQWSMGVKSIENNEKIMIEFALNYPLETVSIKDKGVKRFIISTKQFFPAISR